MTIAARTTDDGLSTVPCAVAWIGDAWASVAWIGGDGEIATSAIHRGDQTESSYLELIVRLLGDARRVVVMGPSSMRLALERAYVALYRWPDRLIDIEHSDWVGEQNLVERLRQLADTVEG